MTSPLLVIYYNGRILENAVAWFYLNEMPHQWYKWGFASIIRNVREYQKSRYDIPSDALLSLYECKDQQQERLAQNWTTQAIEKKYGKIAKHRRETFHFLPDVQEVISLLDEFFEQDGRKNAKKYKDNQIHDRRPVTVMPSKICDEARKEIEICVDFEGNIDINCRGYECNAAVEQCLMDKIGPKLNFKARVVGPSPTHPI